MNEDYSHLKYEDDYNRNLSTLEKAIDEKTGDGQSEWPDESGHGEEYGSSDGDGYGLGFEEYWMIIRYNKNNGMGNGYWNSRRETKIDGNGVGQGRSRQKEYEIYSGILEQLM